MPRPGKRLVSPVLLVAVMATGLLALLAVPGLRPRDMLADRWRDQLAEVPDGEALSRMRAIAELGDAGIPVLVEAAGSDRDSVATTARTVLGEEVQRWRSYRASYSSRKMALLLRHLADRSAGYDSAAAQFAADMATEALQWPIDPESVDRSRLVADCATVLRNSAKNRRPNASAIDFAAADGAGGVPEESASDLPRKPIETGSGPIRVEPVAELPGGDLPLGMVNVPSLPPSIERPRNKLRDVDEPRPFPGDIIESDPIAPPRRFQPPLAKRVPREDRPPSDVSGTEPPGKRMTAIKRMSPDQWSELDDLAVMRRLHAGEEATFLAASEELARRGYDRVQLRLAGYLTDPDPARRNAFAEALPDMAGVNPRPWLLALARDADPQVRLTAVGILATSAGPETIRLIRHLEMEESDPHVQGQLQRILRKRQPPKR